MADIYADIPELSAEAQAIARRRKIAEAMMQRAQTPLESPGMAGGAPIPISWTQGLGQLAQAYVAGQQVPALDAQEKALAERRNQMEADAVREYQQRLAGTPEKVDALPADQAGPPVVTPAVPAPPEQRRAAIIDAMAQSRFPRLSATAGAQQKYDEMDAARAQQIEQRKWEVQQRGQDRLDQIEALAREGRISRAEADARAKELKLLLAQVAASSRPEPAVTPVTIQDPKNPNATIVIDGRSGRVFGSGPKLTEGGKMEAKRQFGMSGLNETLDEAEALLTGTSGKALPTGSTAGALYDTAASVVGMSPEGAKEAQTMKALGGALTSKMPRMEGPQSDKDTQLYKEMAAVVGDATVPRDRRIAALQEVRRLWGKYEQRGSPAAPAATPAPKGAARISSDAEYNALPSGAVFTGPDGKQRRKP